MTVQEVRFKGWRGRVLEWDPIYFKRSANDLGDEALGTRNPLGQLPLRQATQLPGPRDTPPDSLNILVIHPDRPLSSSPQKRG